MRITLLLSFLLLCIFAHCFSSIAHCQSIETTRNELEKKMYGGMTTKATSVRPIATEGEDVWIQIHVAFPEPMKIAWGDDDILQRITLFRSNAEVQRNHPRLPDGDSYWVQDTTFIVQINEQFYTSETKHDGYFWHLGVGKYNGVFRVAEATDSFSFEIQPVRQDASDSWQNLKRLRSFAIQMTWGQPLRTVVIDSAVHYAQYFLNMEKNQLFRIEGLGSCLDLYGTFRESWLDSDSSKAIELLRSYANEDELVPKMFFGRVYYTFLRSGDTVSKAEEAVQLAKITSVGALVAEALVRAETAKQRMGAK